MNSSRPHSVHSKTSLSPPGCAGSIATREAYLQLLLCSTNFPALPAEDGRGAGKISILRPKSEHLHEEEIV
jgi:hypothetical protein